MNMRRYMIENESGSDFTVYANDPKGAIEKGLLELGVEGSLIPEDYSIDELALLLKRMGYLCYEMPVGYYTKKRNERLYKKMAKYSSCIQDYGYSVVTCGECGCVNIYKSEEEIMECHQCGFKSEPCDFPDLFY